MAIYRSARLKNTDGADPLLTSLPDGQLAVMPVREVLDFDVRLPGTIVTREGEVIDVVDLERVQVRWTMSGKVETLDANDLSFVEYASLEGELDHTVCQQCGNRHHPNVLCS